MGLDRRTFLQQAGLALFAWGTTEIGLDTLGKSNNRLASLVKNYQQTLAESTNRKLALLVGINRYPHQENLDGCLTDVELQRELLIHRFGFNPQDIIVLSDRQATRENIETAFTEHLSQQAKADDVVLFHFSGYGGQTKMPLIPEVAVAEEALASEYKLVNSLVPVDGELSTKKNALGNSNSILQDTLLLLAQSLATSKCTFVLDTSFNLTSRSKHSNFKIRSATEIADSPSPQELAFLAELQSKFTNKGLKPSKRLLSLPGVVFSASSKNQVAVERQWDDFSAGLFTHALTQHLWQTTPNSKVQVALAATAASVERVMGKQQQPQLNSPEKSAVAYYLATSDLPTAIGAIDKINKNNKNNLEVKLLGLPANILNAYGDGSCLVGIATGSSTPQLQIKSRDGLTAKVQLLPSDRVDDWQVGDFLQESVRIFNRNLGLTLGLDANLERIERVDATSALANITAVDSAVTIGEQNADCLLGKVEREKGDNLPFSYGLYTAGGRLIGKTSGTDDEAVKIAIARLKPHFNNLLAVKWLELIDNEFSSKLPVNISLASGSDNSSVPIVQKATYLVQDSPTPSKKINFPSKNPPNNPPGNIPVFIKGSNLQMSIDNLGDRQLYLLLFGVDTDSNLFALHTPLQPKPEDRETARLIDSTISPEATLAIPPLENSWQWKVSDSIGINTLYAIFSVKPFDKTLVSLATQESFPLDRQQILNVANGISAVKALMEDLHAASNVSEDITANRSDIYALDVNSWAAVSFVYEIANS